MAEPIPFNELPRPNTPKNWSRRDAEETYQTLERELAQKHDKRGHLYLEPGKYAVLTAASSTSQYGIGINASDHLVLIDMATGNTADFVVNWEDVDGLEAQLVALSDADDTLTAAVAVNASAISDNETAIGAIETEITAARDGEGSLLAKFQSVETAYASADAAIAASVTSLTATVTTNTENISTNAAAITTEASARASGDSANASSIETLSASANSPNPNMVPNANFEANGDGWSESAPSKTAFQNTSGTYGGSYLQFTADGTTQVVFLDDIPVTERSYTISADFIKTVTTGQVYIDCIIFNGGGSNILDVSNDAGLLSGESSASFVRKSLTFTAPSGAATARFRLVCTGVTSGTVRVRRPKMEAGSSVTPWNDDSASNSRSATVTTLREAFVDTNGNAYASIRLVAAASGSDPAEIEILSGDGSSSVVITGDTFIDGDLMVSGSIVTDGLASNAVTNSQVSQTAGSISLANDTWTTVASFSFTSVGIGVELRGTCTISNTASVGSTLGTHEWRLRRDSTTLKSGTGTLASTDDGFVQYRTSHIVADYNDIPSSGTYTYALQVKIGTTTGAVNSRTVTNRYLSGREFKR